MRNPLDASTLNSYYGEDMNVIFDLDGTLANCEHRRHYVAGAVKNWEAFFDECDLDTVMEHVAELLRFYRDKEYTVYILSGRRGSDMVRIKTNWWLRATDLQPNVLEMREHDDWRSDVEVKRDMIERLGLTPENTMAVFDDRNCMVKAWREWGFNCLQVAEGDF